MSARRFTTAHRLRPMHGLSACGDAVIELGEGDWRLFALIDALGHGPDAEKSAKASVAAAALIGLPLGSRRPARGCNDVRASVWRRPNTGSKNP